MSDLLASGVWVLVAYAAVLAALGGWIGRRVQNSGGFFVADRNLGPVLLFATILAANLGAGTTVGAAGLGYRDGLSAWWWVGSAGIGTLLLAFVVGPRLWKVAKLQRLLTVGDFLEYRYGRPVRLVIAILLWFATLTIVSAQLIAMSEIVAAVSGSSRWVGVLLGGTVVLVYFRAGGLISTAWVNLVQLGVLLGGFLIAVPWALSAVGGWDAVASLGDSSEDYLAFLRGGASGWVYVPLLAPAFIVSPGLVQKAYGAANPRALRLGLGAAGVALLLFACVPVLFGMIARAHAPELATAEQALPHVFVAILPPALGLLGLAAVFSAEVSSADAGLFMLSTSLSKDLYQSVLRPSATDAEVLRAARRAAVVGAVLSMLLALVLESVVASLTVFYSILSVSLFVPVVAGVFVRRGGVTEALCAIGAGLAALGTVRLASPSEAAAWLDPMVVGLVVSALVFALLAFVRRK